MFEASRSLFSKALSFGVQLCFTLRTKYMLFKISLLYCPNCSALQHHQLSLASHSTRILPRQLTRTDQRRSPCSQAIMNQNTLPFQSMKIPATQVQEQKPAAQVQHETNHMLANKPFAGQRSFIASYIKRIETGSGPIYWPQRTHPSNSYVMPNEPIDVPPGRALTGRFRNKDDEEVEEGEHK